MTKMGKRVFKEVLPYIYKLVYIFVAIQCLIYAWFKIMLLAVPMAVILLLITDKLIRGEYIMESEVLILHRGRFFKDKELLISMITSVRKSNSVLGKIQIVYNGQKIYLNPENPDAFVENLKKRNESIATENV